MAIKLETRLRNSLTTDQKIIAHLEANNLSDRCVVFSDGGIYCQLDVSTRAIARLSQLTVTVHGNAVVNKVSPLDFRNWQNNAQASQQASDSSVHGAASGVNNDASIDYIFNEAIKLRASDVYFHVSPKETLIYYKVYGNKRLMFSVGTEQGSQLITKLWAAGGSQYERSQPCDTSLDYTTQERLYRIRVNSLDTIGEENVIACRIRDPKEVAGLRTLGYHPQQIEAIETILHAPGGLFLVCGATGSGKSTTISSFMVGIPRSMHMIEIANPVEVRIEGCYHVELNHHDVNFEDKFNKIMAALVRQNPDVLVLGEIRDPKTALAALSMAIQGKLVFSTIHATSLASVYERLAGFGVEAHTLSSRDFISGMIDQTLVPIPCKSCCSSHSEFCDKGDENSNFLLKKLETISDKSSLRFINKAGCEDCIAGISGQTLVAQVYSYVEDSGEVFNILAKKNYHQLDEYMRKTYGVMSKQEHTVLKILAGEIDPIISMKRVGGKFNFREVFEERDVSYESEQELTMAQKMANAKAANMDKQQQSGHGLSMN